MSAWTDHIKATRAANPGMSYKEAMIAASKTWKKGSAPSRSSGPTKRTRVLGPGKSRAGPLHGARACDLVQADCLKHPMCVWKPKAKACAKRPQRGGAACGTIMKPAQCTIAPHCDWKMSMVKGRETCQPKLDAQGNMMKQAGGYYYADALAVAKERKAAKKAAAAARAADPLTLAKERKAAKNKAIAAEKAKQAAIPAWKKDLSAKAANKKAQAAKQAYDKLSPVKKRIYDLQHGAGCRTNPATKRCKQYANMADDERCVQGPSGRCRTSKGLSKAYTPRRKATPKQLAALAKARAARAAKKQAGGFFFEQLGGGCRVNPASKRCKQYEGQPDDDLCMMGPYKRCRKSAGLAKAYTPKRKPTPKQLENLAKGRAVRAQSKEAKLIREIQAQQKQQQLEAALAEEQVGQTLGVNLPLDDPISRALMEHHSQSVYN